MTSEKYMQDPKWVLVVRFMFWSMKALTVLAISVGLWVIILYGAFRLGVWWFKIIGG